MPSPRTMNPNQRHSEEKLLGERPRSDDLDFSHRSDSDRSRRTLRIVSWTFQILLFVTSCSMLAVSIMRFTDARVVQKAKDHMPMWSPALEAVAGTGHHQRFDGSFATPNEYKGTPSPEIDAAWQRITYEDGGVISVSEETLRAVNASVENSVKLAPEIGGGYMASIEVLHQLHCLNMLRQVSYESFYKDKGGAWEDSPQILRYHIDHCIDNLRQKLMCDADTGVLSYVWVKDRPAPFPDFSVQHKCRNFNAVRDWVTEHQVYTKADFKIERQPGYGELESPP